VTGRGKRRPGAELGAIPRLGSGGPRRRAGSDAASRRDSRRHPARADSARSLPLRTLCRPDRGEPRPPAGADSAARQPAARRPAGGAAWAAGQPAARRAASAYGRPGVDHARGGDPLAGRARPPRRDLPRRRGACMVARSDGRGRAKLGGVRVEIRTAADLLTTEGAAEWAVRRAQRDDPALRAIWREFVAFGGPVTLEAAARGLPGLVYDDVRTRAAALHVADLIELDGDRVQLAYPFTTGPND